jgi:hypothetical protein
MIENIHKLNGSSIPTSILDCFMAIVLATSLSFLVKSIYHSSRARHTFDPHFDSVLLFLAPVLAIIMMLIGSNLALSIGMVGSLSILRFRNVIKSSRDMVYIFWLIAIGLGCGTFSYQLILVSTLILGIVFNLYERKYQSTLPERQIIIRGKGKIPLQDLRTILDEHRPISWQETEDGWDYMAEYAPREPGEVLIQDLRKVGADHIAFHEQA